MKSRLLIITVILSISLMFSVHNIHAQESISTWSLTMKGSYEIPINSENLILDYIRAETNNNKILMYVGIEDSANNGSIEFTFPIKAVDEIFNDTTCAFDSTQESSEFLVYVNQNMQDTINADVTDNNIILYIILPPDSGVVEIFSLCSSVIESEKEQQTPVSVSSPSSKHTVRVPVLIQTPNDVDLIISGTLEGYQDGQNVSIMIKNDGDEPIFLSQLIPDHTGYFSLNVTRQGILWDDAGSFTVNAFSTSINDKAIPIALLKPGENKIMSPREQIEKGFESSDVLCNDDLELVIKHDGSPACVKPETKIKLIERGWTTVDFSEEKINVEKISGAKILDFSFDDKNKSILVQIDSFSEGYLIITIPRNVLDSKVQGEDDEFFIIIDGREVDFKETKNKTERTFTIPFESGAKEIEITIPILI